MKHNVGVLMLTKKRFAVAANVLIVLIIFYNIAAFAGRGESIIFSLFLAALVYFIAAASYSLYIDVIKK